MPMRCLVGYNVCKSRRERLPGDRAFVLSNLYIFAVPASATYISPFSSSPKVVILRPEESNTEFETPPSAVALIRQIVPLQ